MTLIDTHLESTAVKSDVSVYIQTLGCKVNQVESDTFAQTLSHYPVKLVSSLGEAQAVIINTCSVTGEADAKTRKAVRKAATTAGVELVIPTGCAAALHEERLGSLADTVRVVADKTAVPDVLIEHFGLVPCQSDADATDGCLPAHLSFRTRVSVKVQDGCENFCSYCIVPYARGPRKSTPVVEVIRRVNELVAGGTKEIVLTGINIGEYRDGDLDFVGLINAVSTQTEIYRIRISSIEPVHITDEFIELISENPKICHHLHIPLQSGSDRVLREMRRRYLTTEFEQAIARLRAVAPEIAITTDVIVGYPTESEQDFTETLEFCERIQFAGIHVFRFSPREGTVAASLNALPSDLVGARAAALREIAANMAVAYEERFAGKSVEMLVERVHNGVVQATSREHLVEGAPIEKFTQRAQGLVDEVCPGDLVQYEWPATTREADAGE